MTKADLCGALPASSGAPASTRFDDYSTAPPEGGNDFFNMVSQACTRNPDKPPLPQPPEAPSSPYSQENYDAARTSDDTAGASETTSADAAEADDKQSPSKPVNKGNSIDSSALSTIMALLGQPAAPSVDLQKLAPVQSKDLKITSGQGDGETKLNESGALPSALPVNNLADPASKPAILAAMKSLADGDNKPLPANATPPGREPPPANPDKPPPSLPQLTAAQDVPLVAQERLQPPVPMDGMGAALNNQRMKFAAEKNEIAGRAVQKLPDASSSGDFSNALPARADIKTDPELSGQAKDSFDPNLLVDLSAKSSLSDLMQANLAEKTQSTDTAAVQAERVAHLVTQEVVMVRQSGANSLAVSLKVDSHTELFLQLTNHNGQIQASVRCERGNIDGLGGHWGDLQESLARQNVQLLPLEDKAASRNSTSNLPPDSTSPRAFNQPSQNQQRQTHDPREEPSLAGAAGVPLQSRKTKTNNRSPQGWESWA